MPRAANRNDPGAGSTRKISAYILAYNAAKKIKAAVETVLWADEIVVVAIPTAPSILPKASVRAWCRCRSTTSATCAIARSKPAGTNGFSASIPTSVVPKRRDEILSLLSDSPSHDAYRMPRRNHMMGRRIRGSGWYANFRQPQLFRKGAMRYTLEPVHEGYELLSDKPLGMLRNAIWQFPFRDLEEVIRKMDRYSSPGAPKLAHKRVSTGSAFCHAVLGVLETLRRQGRLHRRLGRLRDRVRLF